MQNQFSKFTIEWDLSKQHPSKQHLEGQYPQLNRFCSTIEGLLFRCTLDF